MTDRLKQIFSGHGALRTNEMERLGFSRLQISLAAKQGTIARIGRGLYTLPDADISEHQSLIEVVKGSATVRICLLSALRFHNLTTQNSHEVWIAIGPKDRRPAIKRPKLRVYRFSGPALKEGLEEHTVQGASIRVYSVAKTVVDLFRYRNKVGIDVALEALKEGWREKRFAMAEIDRLARLCRMSRIMAPYLETLIA
jgi:predicted transcriptional regulator of viral defense system